jgi:hypothetical protein
MDDYTPVYLWIVYLYLLLGIVCVFHQTIPKNYIVIILYFLFKVLTGYDKCTVSYVECKLRNVKKEESYIYDFLHSIVQLKNTPHAKYIYVLCGICILSFTKKVVSFTKKVV